MRDDSNKAEASTAFKGNLILFSYHIKRREVLTFQPAPGLLHKHFKLCFSIIQLCIPLIHMCRLHQTAFPPLSSPVHLPALWKSQTQNSLAPVFTSRSDSGFRSWVCWGVTARKGSTLHCSHAMPAARNVQSVCWHMGSNAQRAVGSAGTHCWAGMAVPSTRVGPTFWARAAAPLSCSGLGYSVRAPCGNLPLFLKHTGVSHRLVCDTVSTEVNGGESSSLWQLRDAAETFRLVLTHKFTGKVCKRERPYWPHVAGKWAGWNCRDAQVHGVGLCWAFSLS